MMFRHRSEIWRKAGLESRWTIGAISMNIVWIVLIVAVCDRTARSSYQQTTPPEWKEVEQAIGKSGSMQPGDVFKVSLPRTDLHVKVDGVQLKPALALGSWVA